MSGEFRPGDRVVTPLGLAGTVTGHTSGRVAVRYDDLPPADAPWAALGLSGKAFAEARSVVLDARLLRAAGRRVKGRASSPDTDAVRRRWTEAEDAVLAAEYVRRGAAVVAEMLGRTETAVSQRAARLGVVRRKPGRPAASEAAGRRVR